MLRLRALVGCRQPDPAGHRGDVARVETSLLSEALKREGGRLLVLPVLAVVDHVMEPDGKGHVLGPSEPPVGRGTVQMPEELGEMPQRVVLPFVGAIVVKEELPPVCARTAGYLEGRAERVPTLSQPVCLRCRRFRIGCGVRLSVRPCEQEGERDGQDCAVPRADRVREKRGPHGFSRYSSTGKKQTFSFPPQRGARPDSGTHIGFYVSMRQ